ncbi:MAG TPA: hypothetical protein DD761_11630, partial [Cyanobacteria bacterium UBA11691]|nr:hypothetical protein [Cyanobacteria bacterium UBA11691]
LADLKQAAVEAIATCEDLQKLEELRIAYLGKKGHAGGDRLHCGLLEVG